MCVCVCVCVCVLYGTNTVRCLNVHSIQHATSLFLHISLPLWWFLIKQQRCFTEQRNDQHRIIDLFISDDINCQIVICPNVSAEKKRSWDRCRREGSQSYFLESMSTLTPPRYPLSIHICFAAYKSKRVQTTFVIHFDFCFGGRAQHRVLTCMWQNHLNQMLQTEPFLSVVMNEITCMITVLFRSIF